MDINQDFLNYIRPYLAKLQEKIGDDFVVFGSAPLYLFGIAEFAGKINDLDVSVKDWADIPVDAEVVTFHKDPNQKFCKVRIDDMEIDIASLWPGCEHFFKEIHDKPVIVDGFKFANLDIVEEWKREMVKRYDRQKDKDYLDKIKEFRRRVINK
ncbi:MAG: hypothetical protein WC719_01150 [Patescibacteria group bacterium]|jgi:hypothetical protein